MAEVGFCTLDDVEAALPKIGLSESSRPTVTDAEGYVYDIAAEMRGVLAKAGYAVVQTDPDALQSLRLINVHGAAALTEKAAFPGSDQWRNTWELYQLGLKSIRTNEVYNLTVSGGGTEALVPPRSYYTSNPTVNLGPRFKVNEQQW